MATFDVKIIATWTVIVKVKFSRQLGQKQSNPPIRTSTTKKLDTEVTTERKKSRVTDDTVKYSFSTIKWKQILTLFWQSLGTWRPVGEYGECGFHSNPFFVVGVSAYL